MLDVDRLVYSFRETASLPNFEVAYGGWEAPDQELRGHFVGHYLSASAQMWASTSNDTLKKKMTAVVSALVECQEKIGTVYLSAFTSKIFNCFEAIKPVWAPYYTIHKIMASLVDQYVLAGNNRALKMVTQMADYFYKRVQKVITEYTIERHWLSLNEETGGMNDILWFYIMMRYFDTL
ncbi:glycosyl hydrolase [Tanacetum coccineum]